MKIRAIRLAECGRFQAPMAVEDLSGGLDVLAEANEFGKSTILRALRFALTEKHTSKSKETERFRPYAGGAPTIEVDLEIANELWRLRKRYLTQRSAELRSLGDGRLMRGEDAEAKLAELLGGDRGKGRLPLLWLSQGEASDALGVADASRPLLEAVLAGEVQAIVGGTRTRRLRERIRARLEDLVTEKQQRPKGRNEAVRRRLKEIEEALAEATRKAALASTQRDRLAALREREAWLSRPEYKAQLESTAAAASARREQAKEAAGHLAAARQAASLAEARLGSARQALASYERTETEHADVSGDIERTLADRAGLADRMTAADVTARDSAAKREDLRATLSGAEAALQAARVETRRAELTARQATLEQRLAEAVAVEQRRQRASSELAGLVATEMTLAAARSELAEIDRLEARLSAAAIGIAIHYLPGSDGRISLGGRSLADGERLQAVDPLVLEIAGVGRITIAPGGTEVITDVREDIAAHREQFASLLARGGCDSIAALEAAVARRQDLTVTISEEKARLSGLAPGGIPVLEKERDSLRREISVLPPPTPEGVPTETIMELEAGLANLRQRLQAVEREAATAAGELARLRGEDMRLESALADRRQRLQSLAALLPTEGDRSIHKTKLTLALADAEASLNEATRQIAAWQEKTLSQQAFTALEAAVEAAQSDLHARDRELASIATEAARIEGELSSLGNDNAEADAVALADARAEAAGELNRIEDEVAALQMLAREIDAEQALVRDRYLAPVTARLQPYIDLVFPAAALSLDAALTPEALARGAAPEPIGNLSDGTREQIAVLSRLAFARLIADGNHAAPLVLDDPLVYADDARIAAMFRALQLASASHQVLVLTCHQRAFEGLGGTRVRLSPWVMSSTALQ